MWKRMAICLLGLCATAALAQEMTATDIIRKAMDHYRGLTSYSEMTMTIHRTDWERSMTIQAWTEGEKRTLVRVVEPKKDAGNGTLSVDGNMWTYTPKINRVIKIPSSMMSQSWMGSDFSNKDVSKDTNIIDQYDHSLLEQYEKDGHQVYVIQSIPHEDAAVVWGKEILWVRDDWVLLEQQFWDQDGALMKTLKTLEIAPLGGRSVAVRMRMANQDKPEEWTELHTLVADFDVELPANSFTLSNLRNPRGVNVSWVLAWRNIWRHRRRTWLTVGAMVFCNVLLVFLVSLQLGSYQMMIDGSLAAYTGHIQVQRRGYHDDQHIYQSVPAVMELASSLRSVPGVGEVAARAEAFALASSAQRSFGILLTGVQPGYEPAVSTFPGKVREGRYLQADDAREIVIGALLAQNLKAGVGDELTFIGSGRDGSFAAAVATVVGILDTGLEEVDRSMAQIPLGWFQQVFAMGDAGHSVVIRVPSLEQVGDTAAGLRAALAGRNELVVLDWERLMPGLRQAITSDMASAWFTYGVLVLLVAFSVLNTQLMSVLERTREFGVMLALGMRPAQLARLVGMETLMLAALGLGLGVAGGGLLAAYLSYAGFVYPGVEEMMARFMLGGRIYPQLSPVSLLAGPLTVFLGALLAALYPALRLFRLQPVAAMRAL